MLIKDMVNTNASAKSDLMLRGDVKIKLHNTKSGNTEFIEGHNTFMSDALNVLVRENGINSYGAGSPLFDSMRQLLLFHEQINDGDYHLPLYAKPYGMADDGTGNTATDMGSLNPNEVESGFGFYKSVYDFSTSQCNGELKAVGYYNQCTRRQEPTYLYPNIFKGQTTYNLSAYKNAFYSVIDGKLTAIPVPGDRPVFIAKNPKNDYSAEINAKFTDYPENPTIIGTKAYSYYITSDLKLREMVFDMSTLDLTITDNSVAGLEKANTTYFCTTDTENKYVYCYCDNKMLYKIDKSAMAVTKSASIDLSGYKWIKYFNGGILCLKFDSASNKDGYCDKFILEDLSVTTTSFALFKNSVPRDRQYLLGRLSTSEDGLAGVLIFLFFQSASQTRYLICAYYKSYPLMLTTYNLPEAITKTASQTMKITYTLTEA